MFSPGSLTAFQSGCTCPIMANNEGYGNGAPGSCCKTYVICLDCPHHGQSAWDAMEAGSSRLGMIWEDDYRQWSPRYFPGE